MKKFFFALLVFSVTKLGAASGGFLFVTFKGEQTPMAEQIYFALSTDGRNWRALNSAEPILVSQVGEKGARDPYLVRAHGGNGFYLLATDLSINLNRDWKRAVRAGSRSILIWESKDLIHWSEPRLVEVAPPEAGCTWAPEAVYDEEAGDYLVFWASTSKDDDFAKHRIWAVRTRDFKTFSAPFVYIEKSNTVIDTTIVREGTTYYRFSKDEREKSITMESSTALLGPWTEMSTFSLAHLRGYEGPQCYVLEPATDAKPATWCLILDHYRARAGYQPYVATELSSGQFAASEGFTFPFHFRHGSVLRLSADEFQRVDAAYRSPAP